MFPGVPTLPQLLKPLRLPRTRPGFQRASSYGPRRPPPGPRQRARHPDRLRPGPARLCVLTFLLGAEGGGARGERRPHRDKAASVLPTPGSSLPTGMPLATSRGQAGNRPTSTQCAQAGGGLWRRVPWAWAAQGSLAGPGFLQAQLRSFIPSLIRSCALSQRGGLAVSESRVLAHLLEAAPSGWDGTAACPDPVRLGGGR